MRLIALFCLLISTQLVLAQSLPMDFEMDIVTTDFVDFDGGMAMVIDNPDPSGINTSSKVAQVVRDGGAIWAGSKISLDANIDFSTLNELTMKVWTTAPIGTTVKFKLEGDGSEERDVQTTKSGEWEELTWDFTGTPMLYNDLVFMFDFGNVGDGSETSTFLFDEVAQLFGGIQIDWPVDFESEDINYTMTDFGGNDSELVSDPSHSNNQVIQVIKTDQAATWAGTTIGTNAGFATDIPLSLTDSKMTVRVWSPRAGTPIRLKVEDSNDPTHTCETETNSTVSEAWEIIEFDFLNQAPGTELLSIGLDRGWKYNMASIFFNFGTEGQVAGEETYYFDDVFFGDLILSTADVELTGVQIYPNPTHDRWVITSEEGPINSVQLYDVTGKLVYTQQPTSPQQQIVLTATGLEAGVYMARVSGEGREAVIRLVKK